MSQHVLGVDIAARKGAHNCGAVLLDVSKITALDQPADDFLWAGVLDGTNLAEIAAVVSRALSAQALLLLERQFPGVRSGAGVGDIEKLIGSRVRFETVAQIRSVTYELVYPATWQAKMYALLGADCPMKVSKPRKPKQTKAQKQAAKAAPAQQDLVKAPKMIKDSKAASRLLAARLYPDRELTPDQCDAIVMARVMGWERRR